MKLEQVKSAINEEVHKLLEIYRCETGDLHYQAPSMILLRGFRVDGREVSIMDTGPRLSALLSQYIELLPDCDSVTIEVDLRPQYKYSPFSNAAIQKAAEEKAAIEKQQKAAYELAYKEKLEALRLGTEKYGLAFAEKVANGLLKGGYIGYSHRDYCGMGLEYRDGVFTYGEVHDGYMRYPVFQSSSKESFIDWLADQSDASLARLEEENAWYWGNQTIDRKRLLVLWYKGGR
jgi:hypothetical protein